jgi:hypothetical protein
MSAKGEKREKGTIEILFEKKFLSINKGVKIVDEEYMIKGDKGTKIKFYHKDDKGTEKIVIAGRDGKYIMKVMDGTDVKETALDEAGMKKELKGKLKFAKEQLGGSRR